MSTEERVGKSADLSPGTVIGAGRYAVGNVAGRYFAVTRRCRHLGADLAGGRIDDAGCLVCPWHQAAYDVDSGRMVRGPRGVFAKFPGSTGDTGCSPGCSRSAARQWSSATATSTSGTDFQPRVAGVTSGPKLAKTDAASTFGVGHREIPG